MSGKRELYGTQRKGLLAELIAAQWLVKQGFWTFTPLGQQGPIDIIAISKTGTVLYFDVKTLSRRKDGTVVSRSRNDFQKVVDLQVLYVDLDNGAVYLQQNIPGIRSGKNFSTPRVTEILNI